MGHLLGQCLCVCGCVWFWLESFLSTFLLLQALSKAITEDELYYLRAQFTLLEPKHGYVSLDNFRTVSHGYYIIFSAPAFGYILAVFLIIFYITMSFTQYIQYVLLVDRFDLFICRYLFMTLWLMVNKSAGSHEKFNWCHEGVKGSWHHKCGKRSWCISLHFDLVMALVNPIT